MPKSETSPTKRQTARARKYVREHTSEILLHSLALRWGISTRLFVERAISNAKERRPYER